MSVPVTDQDAALRFYTEVLGCELRTDREVWPGARLVAVVPPGSEVSILLLRADGDIPVALRLGTSDADRACESVRDGGVDVHESGVIRMEGVPAMFSFADPEGNALVYLEDAR